MLTGTVTAWSWCVDGGVLTGTVTAWSWCVDRYSDSLELVC